MKLANAASAIVLVSCWVNVGHAAETTLPLGSNPPALSASHFSDRLHEFVWRNWSLVEPREMADLLGASADDLAEMAASMGLPRQPTVPAEMKTRGYITLIRRNWHLLPYEQLQRLVGMTPERLAFMLRAEDALWEKLGCLKPKCEPLRWRPPDETARRREAEIRRIVEETFGDEIHQPAEPRFGFVRKLRESPIAIPLAGMPPKAASKESPLRFIYSYFAVYGDPLLDASLDPYPEALLRQLSAIGINGVWLHVVLRDMAPGGNSFPEFGVDHKQRLANLHRLVDRAKQFGIGVYLYVNEPRAMPNSFFGRHPEVAGVHEGDLRSMCTSHPGVRQWMSDALAYVFHEVPDLAGVFTITASESLTNCASHYNQQSCPRCKSRTDAEIYAEVNAAIEQGVHRGNSSAKVIVWDWGWHKHGDAADVIAALPRSVWLMSVSEWSLPLRRGGIADTVGEYAMSTVGPGPRAARHWQLAKNAGLKTVAKVQLNNSWELSIVPYLPVMDLVAEHCRNLASAKLDGMMLSWTLGGYPSPNLAIASRFFGDSEASQANSGQAARTVGDVLDDVAAERFGAEGAPLARQAWTAFSTAFRQYPFDCAVVYQCPVQTGPANPLYLSKTGYAATMTGIPYDNLTMWRGPYPADVFAKQFERMADGWRSGIPLLRAAVEKSPPACQEDAKAELRYAEVACIHFQSVANQVRFVVARDTLADPEKKLSPRERGGLLAEIHRRLQSEIVLARRLYTLSREDSRIGFEPSNHYFYLPGDLVEKVLNCRDLLERFR
ncbi:MAG: hypothetical protein LLG00_03130 [Planctomycetaceae bacterium]|nr:hypothetical protein [Planctomycetaceae bacterium]